MCWIEGSFKPWKLADKNWKCGEEMKGWIPMRVLTSHICPKSYTSCIGLISLLFPIWLYPLNTMQSPDNLSIDHCMGLFYTSHTLMTNINEVIIFFTILGTLQKFTELSTVQLYDNIRHSVVNIAISDSFRPICN